MTADLTKGVACWLTMVAAATFAAPHDASAQLAKSGTYSGVFGFYEQPWTAVPIDKERLIISSMPQGPFINDQGSGFLHLASVVCVGQGIVEQGKFAFNGHCTATDKDGDKAALAWRCAESGGRCVGTFDWVGGTGKYTGIKGHSQFHGGGIGQGAPGPIGYAVWKGEWQLP